MILKQFYVHRSAFVDLATVLRDRPLLVDRAGGYRSPIAASLLEQRGLTGGAEIAGGIVAWAAKLPMQSPVD